MTWRRKGRNSLGALLGMALVLGSWGSIWSQDGAKGQEAPKAAEDADPTAAARNRMVQRHLVERGITRIRESSMRSAPCPGTSSCRTRKREAGPMRDRSDIGSDAGQVRGSDAGQVRYC
jgi:hypothetical protein